MLFVSHHVNESDAPAVKDDEPSGTLILTVWAETMNHEPKLVPFLSCYLSCSPAASLKWFLLPVRMD